MVREILNTLFHCSMAIDEGDKGGQCIFADIEKF
jgi:hypothetical protein